MADTCFKGCQPTERGKELVHKVWEKNRVPLTQADVKVSLFSLFRVRMKQDQIPAGRGGKVRRDDASRTIPNVVGRERGAFELSSECGSTLTLSLLRLQFDCQLLA